MEKKKEENLIDDKYILVEWRGGGGFSKVCLVKDKANNKEYAMKILLKIDPAFQEEIEIHKKVSQLNHPNIINLLDFGQKDLIINNKIYQNNQYLILDYASKGELYNYLYYPKRGFLEKHAKVIFYKILQAMKAIHDMKICHRDLKLQNIIFDQNFNPKICDFGLAVEINPNIDDGKIKIFSGTPDYQAPEVLYKKSHDGFKADIFTLGVILLNLVTGRPGFHYAIRTDEYYKNIWQENYKTYWKNTGYGYLSKEVKDLYLNMVQLDPNKRLKDIQAVMDHAWFKDRDESANMENEIYEEFLEREKIIIQKNGTLVCQKFDEDGNRISSDRNIDNEGEEFFKSELNLKYAKTGVNMKDFLKIIGKNINPQSLMNYIANQIIEKYKCQIKENETKARFDIFFCNQNEEKNEDSEFIKEMKELGLDEIIKKKECIIRVKLYESENGGYIMKFSKKSGGIEDYCKNLNNIMNLLKEKLELEQN